MLFKECYLKNNIEMASFKVYEVNEVKDSLSLDDFNNEMSSKCIGKTDLLNGVFYNSINISTMTVCFNLNQPIDLKLTKK